MEYLFDCGNTYTFIPMNQNAASNYTPHFYYRNVVSISDHASLMAAELENFKSRVEIVSYSMSALKAIISLKLLNCCILLFELGFDMASGMYLRTLLSVNMWK